MSIKKISTAVINRLPRYYRYLGELLENGIERISSQELSEKMHVTASQIRQDLNNFGGFGQQGYGYNVENLHIEVEKILGLENNYSAVIIGSGNLGQALANYTEFEKRGFVIKGIFDVNPILFGITVRGIKILDINSVKEFVRENSIDIAILTIPKMKASAIANDLAECGIKGIWNFAPVDLEISNSNVVVENVHLSESLMTLSYRIKNREETK